MAKKLPLKERNPQAYYRNVQWACVAGEWTSLFAPIVAIFGAKFDEYFQVVEGSQYKMTIGSILCIVVAVIVTYKQVRHQEKVDKSETMLPFVIGLGIAFMLSYLFSVVLQDLTLILGCEFAGSCVAYGFDGGIQKAKALRNEARADARQEKVMAKANTEAFKMAMSQKEDGTTYD